MQEPALGHLCLLHSSLLQPSYPHKNGDLRNQRGWEISRVFSWSILRPEPPNAKAHLSLSLDSPPPPPFAVKTSTRLSIRGEALDSLLSPGTLYATRGELGMASLDISTPLAAEVVAFQAPTEFRVAN
jgi:hypothetical protein